MTQQAEIGGETVTIHDFSAFKALKAMDIVGAIEEDIRALMDDAADFRREYGERNVVELSRAEARRQFRPTPLYKHREDDGKLIAEPVLVNDEPVMTDPLAHLTDADWQASGNVLRLPEQPSNDALMAALAPKAFARARTSVLRLVALAIVQNGDLERWDGSADIDEQLDEEANRLIHKAKASELVALAVVVMQACQEQLAGPFAEAVTTAKIMFGPKETPEDPEPERQPMTLVETDEPGSTDGPQTSSTDSPGDTAGDQARSSTEPASGSSSS